MRKWFFALLAATLALTGCDPEENIYIYEDISFRYSPEFTITEETPLPGGVHVVLKGMEDLVMYADITKPGGGIEDASWAEKEAFVKREADAMMQTLRNDPSYEWTWEPLENTSKHDRWSPDDEIPTSTWDIIQCKKDGELHSVALFSRLYGKYLVRLRLEGPTEDKRGELVWIASTFRLDASE